MGTRSGPSLAIACSLAVWAAAAACARSSTVLDRQTDVQAAEQIVWGRPQRVASGPAIRGPWQMNQSDYRWVDDPTVDVAGHTALVVWADQTRKDIFFRAYDAQGKPRAGAPLNVSRSSSTFSWLPRIAAGAPCTAIHVLWQEIVFSGGTHGGEIFHARSVDGGRTFGEPSNLSNSQAGDGKGRLDRDTWDNGSLDLACARRGQLFAVWTDYEGRLWLRQSKDAGSSFAPAVKVAGTPTTPARAPSVAAADDGVVHVAHAVGEAQSAPIRVHSSSDGGGAFLAPRELGTRDAHADAPQVAVSGSGTLHVVFAESLRGRSGPYRVRYARARPNAVNFTATQRLALAGAGSEAFPTVSVDARQRVYVLWEVSAGPLERSRALAMSYSLDAGAHFARPFAIPGIAGAELGSNGSQQGMLMDKLAASPEGDLAIVNSTFDAGSRSLVWLLRARIKESDARLGSSDKTRAPW